ncbi:hypothetical protein OROMI_007646 [Orobanche minor]
MPSQEILKIRDGTPLEVFKIRPSQEILKIRDGTPLEAEGILTYQKGPRNCSVWHFSSKLDVPSNVVQNKRVARILVFKIRPSQEILKIRDGTPWEVFKIRPSQEILKIRDGTPLEAEGILTYQKGPRNCSVWHFSSKLDVPSNVVQNKRVARILVFRIRPSQEILKIRDGTPLEAEGILTYRKKLSKWPSQEILKIRVSTPLEAEGIFTYQKGPRNCSVWHFSSKLDVRSNVVQKKRVARILVFKIRPSQEILKIRDGTPLEMPSQEILKIRDGTPLEVFKIRPSQEILKIRDGTPLEAEGILTYQKGPRNCSVWNFSSKLDVPSNVVQNKRVARILVFKIRPSQEILKIRDGTPLEAEGILTYRKKLSKWLGLVFKIRPSQEILKIRDGTPLEAEGILTYQKGPRNCSVWHFSSKLDVPSNVVQNKRVARILVFRIRPSQEILKIRDGTPLEAEGILTYRKKLSKWLEPSQEILKIRVSTPLEAEGIFTYQKGPRNCSVWHFSSKLDVRSNVVQKKRVARILVFKIRPSQEILKIRDGTPLEVFKIRPSQEILKIRDGTPLEAEGILTYQKGPRNCSVWNFSSKLDVPSNVVQNKRVARILVFKIRPSQEILKIRDGTPLEVFKIRPSQEILKIRDGTPLEAEGILTYQKGPRNCSVWHFSSKLDVPSNVVQNKRVARIQVFKIRPSQEILKIRDGTPLEAEGILTYRKRPSQEILKIRDGTPLEAEGILTYQKGPRNCSVWHFSSKLDVPSNVVQNKRVARILVFKIRPSQEILKIRDGTPLEAEGILTYRKKLSKWLGLVFKIRPSQEILKIRDGTPLEAEGILTYQKGPRNCSVFKIRPSQEILKIRDGTPLEAEGILTYQKGPRNCSVWNFSSKLDVPSNVVQNKRVARILVFKIRPSQEILKIRDGTPLEVFKIRPSQEILKIRDGTPLEAEGILTYQKGPRNCSVWHFSSKLDVPSNVVQNKRVARILVFKIRPSQEILKIRDGTPLEAGGILTYRKKLSKCNVVQNKRVARILVFKIRPSQEILKIRDGTPLEAEGILTYQKGPRNCSVWHFSSKLDVPSNVVQNKRVARILVFKIRPSQEILKIRDVVFKIRPSQEILKIRDGTPLEAEGILTYQKGPRNCSVWHFSSKLDVPSNVVQNKRVARILVFRIRPSQEILKIRDGTPLEAEGILTYRKKLSKWPSQEILKIRVSTPLEAEGILTYQKGPRNCSVWHFSSKLDVRSNVVQKKRVARILVFKIRPSQEILKIRDGTPVEVFKIRPSQEILKIRDGTPLEAEGILTYQKGPRNCSVWNFSSKLDVPSNVVQNKRVARILVFKIRPSQEILKIRDGTPLEVFKIRPSQEILKIRDGTPLEAEGILTYQKGPRNCSVWHFSSKLDVPSNVVQNKRVARILVFKIRPSQEILKIRDGTPLEAGGILTYRKKLSKWLGILTYQKGPRNCSVFKIRPSQEILKIRDGTPLEAEGILTYQKGPRNCSVWNFSSKLDVPSNVVQNKRVARILVFKIRPSQEILKIRDGTPLEVFKIRPSQEILKIRDGTPLEAEGILTYQKGPRNCSVWHFSSKLDVPSNVVQNKRVARILVFKIRPSQEILKIRDGTPLEAGGILTYRKKLSKWLVQNKRVARILVFKIRPSQEILKIRDGTPLEAEGILTYQKGPRNCSVWHFSSKLDVPSNVVQNKRVARILVFKIRPSQEILKIRDVVFKIRPSQEILKIRDGTPLEAEGILTYQKGPRNCSVWHFSSKLDVPSNVVQNKRVARILVFRIRPSQEILKIRDGTPLEAEGILTYRKKLSKWPSQEILKIRVSTPLEAEGILTYQKGPRNCSVWHFSSKLDVRSNVVQKKRVARILVFKIRPSQEILKIRDGTPVEAEGILTYRKKPSKWPSQEILKIRDGTPLEVFKIRPSQEILKIRDGTPLEAEGILTYQKGPRNCSVWHFSSKLDVPSNVVQNKRVARILVFKIRPSQEILKIRDGTPLEAGGILTYRKKLSKWLVQNKRVARILVFKIRPSQEILKIRDGTPLEAEGILTYQKGPRNCSVWHFSSKLDVPSNVVQNKRVARILVFKIRPSQEILKIRDGTPLEAEGILTYQKSDGTPLEVFKIRPSQEILKIRDGTPLEAEGILTYQKGPRNCSVWHFSSKLDVPSNVVQNKRVARIQVFKIRPSQEILKISDGTPLEAEGILTYRKRPSELLGLAEGILTYQKGPRNCSVWHFSSKLDVPSNVVQNKRVARIQVFKIRPSQEILKIRDGTPLEAEGILTYRKKPSRLVFKIRPSQEILKIRDGTPLEAEGILTYQKGPRNCSVWHFSSKLDVPSNVVQNKRVARILVFKIRPSQEILKIRDGTPLEAEGILTYRKKLSKWLVVFKIRPSQEILKIRDGTPLEAEGILTYQKGPRNCSVWNFSSKLDVPSNVVQNKRVARILVFKIRPSQEILKIRDGTPLEVFKIRPSQEILKIRDGTPLEAEGILTYQKGPRNCSVWNFSSKLDVPSNVVQNKRVARILVFKIRPSQEILKIRDGTPLEVFKIRPSQEILKIRDGTPLEAEGILTYQKGPRNCSVWNFSSKLDVPSNVVQNKRVARILVFKIRPSQEILKIRDGTPLEVFKIRPSQEILKIRDGTPLEAEGILTYQKGPRNCSVWHFSSKLDVPSNVVQNKRVARILVFKIRPSQEILKIRDGTPLEAGGILTYRKKLSKWLGLNKRVARILVFKIRPSQEILKIRDGTPLEAEGILTYQKGPRNCSVWHFSSKLDVPSNVVQNKRVAWILVFKIRPSQEILKIRDGTPLEAEGILTYQKRPSKLLGLALF